MTAKMRLGGKMDKTKARTLKNFLKKHGRRKLLWMLKALQDGKSGQEIANELGVTRERVRQWKMMFGEPVTTYKVDADVIDAIYRHRGSED
jgi:hypothetical protein